MTADYKIIKCENSASWRRWLENNHSTCDGVWLRIYKKNSSMPTVSYPEALDHAICFGWIDGLKRSYDEESYIQKFTPRRKRSIWSKRNIEHVARLCEAGLMTDAGMAEVDRAKQDGRWQAAYDSPVNMEIPTEFIRVLNDNAKAKLAFELLSKSDKYFIGFQLQTAKKQETKERRIQKIISNLENGVRLQ